MIFEYVFIGSLFLYVIQSYVLTGKKNYDKSVFESAEILSHKLRDGLSIESSIEFISKSDLKCRGLFESILGRMERGDNLSISSDYIAKKYGNCPSGYLAKIIGCASKYNQNISEIFIEFFNDMKSAYMIVEERKKELVTQSFIVFLIGCVMVPSAIVMMSSMFNIEIAFFIIVFLLVQSYFTSVASVVVGGEFSDMIFMVPLGMSITILIIKYGLGGGGL
ncbi:MAG: hypothetical protein K0B07_01710 [DPANN group archaeon]|nr:hypothetical protein [DPANN group archaeon]